MHKINVTIKKKKKKSIKKVYNTLKIKHIKYNEEFSCVIIEKPTADGSSKYSCEWFVNGSWNRSHLRTWSLRSVRERIGSQWTWHNSSYVFIRALTAQITYFHGILFSLTHYFTSSTHSKCFWMILKQWKTYNNFFVFIWTVYLNHLIKFQSAKKRSRTDLFYKCTTWSIQWKNLFIKV